jgi:RNA polymerase sigma-70 factor (ECF subfamily)
VAVNICKDHLKRAPTLDYDDYAATLSVEENHDKRDLLDAVRALPEDYRSVVYLYFYEGYNFSETAAILHISESTVRRYMERAKAQLKDVLEERQVSKI